MAHKTHPRSLDAFSGPAEQATASRVERFEADAPVKPTRAPRIAPSNLKREGKKTADLRTLPTLGTALEHTVPTQRFTQTGPGISTLGISSTTA
ncbi:hypothetical protein HO133_010481 [Letharia lupina]|uniref:Uncharacterized protein n=1 Tax=Letharia lupina TaxID=560253 RepID=A0A8H6CKM4_9LECA|nr:uncharacterized protein HO133_010481 [Letharia lupina]KAF6225283.1 hypothetical protein HO133_010481 [Letharia lupina]